MLSGGYWISLGFEYSFIFSPPFAIHLRQGPANPCRSCNRRRASSGFLFYSLQLLDKSGSVVEGVLECF